MSTHPDTNDYIICDGCQQVVNVYYMCDEDSSGKELCGDCFPSVKCEERHGEGCSTMVILGA